MLHGWKLQNDIEKIDSPNKTILIVLYNILFIQQG